VLDMALSSSLFVIDGARRGRCRYISGVRQQCGLI
jgi:hypothetical protein